MKPLLEGQTAWIVGAAGTLGVSICRRFAAEGARLVLSGRDRTRLEEVADELGSEVSCLVCPMDITERSQVDSVADRAIRRFHRVDILVNSTTCPVFADFLELTDDNWSAVLNAKAMGYMRTARAILPHMVANERGAIINISGRGGHQPTGPAHLAGSCANAAVDTLTKGLANVFGPKGIRVNAVAPGPVRSPRYERIAESNQAVAAKTGSNQPASIHAALGEMAEASDIADGTLYLASDLSRFVTGIVLQVDGGGTVSL